MPGVGKLSMVVWPAYIGVALEGTTPPFSANEPHDGGYERGQIHWYPSGLTVQGRAKVLCPPGTYTHFVYFKHPVLGPACGVSKMDYPITFRVLTILDVDPIVNTDLSLLEMKG
jgi:hypothetical protein